MICGREHAAAA